MKTFKTFAVISCVVLAGALAVVFGSQRLAWDKDDLAFAIEIIEEADTIMADAMAGLAFLTKNPDVLQDLQCNIQDRHNHD